MPTRLYFPSGGSPDVSPAAGSGWNTTTSSVARPLVLSTAITNTALTDQTLAGTATTPELQLFAQFVSPPLAAQTISGTLTGIVRGLESNANANATLAIGVRVVTNAGAHRFDLLATTASDLTTTTPPEFGTTAATRRFQDAAENATISLTSQTVNAGDRLVVEVGARNVDTSTARTVTLRFGDPSGTADFALTDGLTTDLRPWVEFSGTIAFTYTGTAAESQAAQTESASGAQVFTGTEAVSQAAQTVSASGTRTEPALAVSWAVMEVPAVVSNDRTGTITTTQAAQTAAASGQEIFTGTAATSQAAQTDAAAGQLVFTGTAATTQAAQTESATGAQVFTGTAAETQAAQTMAAAGTYTPLAITGTASTVQAAQTESATGAETFTATAATVQAAQTAAASGAEVFTGTAGTAQAAQTASAAGALVFTGTGSTAQAAQTAAASGALVFAGSAATTQAAQTEAGSGTVSEPSGFFGDAATTQAAQTAAGTGTVEQVVTGPPIGAALGFAEAIQFGRTLPSPVSGRASSRQAPQRVRATGGTRPRAVPAAPPPPLPIAGAARTRQRPQRAQAAGHNELIAKQRQQRGSGAGVLAFPGAVGTAQAPQRVAAAGRIIWEAEDLLMLGLVEEAVAQGIDPREVVRWLLRERELEGAA